MKKSTAYVATLPRMCEIYNDQQIEFWIDELPAHGIAADVVADIKKLPAEIAAQIVRDLITDGDLPPEFDALAALLDGYDEAAVTNFGGNGCADYIDAAMQPTNDAEAWLVEGEACITASGRYVAWTARAPLRKGGVMVVKLRDDEAP